MADQMREETHLLLAKGISSKMEDKMAAHLLAWAQCNLIPMYSTKNKKCFAGCHFRPDFTWSLPGLNVLLECDQDAHSTYDRLQESKRMQTLLQAAEMEGHKHIVFIRFNPNLSGSSIQLKFATLQIVLMDVFSKRQEYTDTKRSVIYMFYPDSLNVWYPAEASTEETAQPAAVDDVEP